MNPSRDYLVGLAQLHDLGDADERRRAWRQGLASLSAAALNQRAAPLEAVSPDGLLSSIRMAFRTGLVDDVHWMSPSFAAAAFFEIAAALPASEEKRELGRRVLEALLTGDSATFALLATSLASTSRRGLSTPPVRARVAVAVRLPIGLETDVDRLALALLCRPDLEREWLSGPSVGALPARRVAARLMERAAREAARRALDGDDFGTRIFRRPRVRAAFGRLLADRESLVWRHAASARGLLAGVDDALVEEIERGLSDDLGPTEWRRAAASLAASLAHKPTSAAGRCQELLAGEMMQRDPGVAAVMIFGLSRAATLEPEAVEALLPLLIEAGDIEAIEAYVDLLGEHPGGKFGGRATTVALERLRSGVIGVDDGVVALGRVLDGELSPLGGAGRRPSLRQHVFSAQMAFVEGRDLRPHVEAALATAGLGLGLLERIDETIPAERQRAFAILRDLDRGLLESSLLADLMLMVGLDPTARGPSDLGGLIGRMRTHLLRSPPLQPGPEGEPLEAQQGFVSRRRLRALVHAIDGEGFPQWDETVAGTRERRLRTTTLLLERLAAEGIAGEPIARASVRRPILAALARAVEGLVRDELAEIGELALFIGARLHRADDFVVLSEATLSPEIKEVFGALAELSRRWDEPGADPASVIAGFAALAEVLPPGLTAPVEAVRRAIVIGARTLGRIVDARSLLGLTAGPGAGSLIALGETVQDLAALVTGVWRRLGQPERHPRFGRDSFVALEAVVAQAGRGAPGDLGGAVADAVAGSRSDLPHVIAEVIARALGRLPSLPAEANDKDAVANIENERALPSWLPPSRVLGGFYVQRPVGRGTAGSVFVVCRAEDRHDASAERFALKVPTYGGSVAHTLSEPEFLRMFREEAGALLTLPTHRNLAGFVTFDARARPRPILVMELVDGLTLDRALARGDLSFQRLVSVLDGIAAGLQAMHALGVGHLDVKPANVIIRTREKRARAASATIEAPAIPVLVDFGLAGRKIRPGCASPFYGAPEVWMNDGVDPTASPAAADVYSFCCLAYELMTGARLFTGESLPAVIAAHFAHEGDPAGLQPLRSDARFQPLADWLARGLKPRPAARASIAELRARLAELGTQISTNPRELGLAGVAPLSI
jgi:hypothetical protein